jgi:hypothetical protein
MSERNENVALQSILFILAHDFLHAVKSYDMGPLALLHLWRKVCWRFLSFLKIHCLEPQTMSSMASTLSITPPRWLLSYAGFTLRRVLEVIFKGNRRMGWPWKVWFCQVLEDEEGELLARNSKDWWLFVREPAQNCTVLEEKKIYAGFNLIDW